MSAHHLYEPICNHLYELELVQLFPVNRGKYGRFGFHWSPTQDVKFLGPTKNYIFLKKPSRNPIGCRTHTTEKKCSQENLIDGSGTIFIGKSYRSFGHLDMHFWWNSLRFDLPEKKTMESYRTNVRVALLWMQYCLQKLNLWRILHTKQSTMHYMFHRKYEGIIPFYRTPVISGSMTTWMTTHKSCNDVCKCEVGKLLVSNGTERSLCIQNNKNCAGSPWKFNGWYCRCIHIYI